MLSGWSKKRENSLFFEPGRQEGDHFSLVGHRTSIMNLATGVLAVNVPKGCNCVLAQAIDQNVNYTISGTDPTATSGFSLIAGNDPLTIPCRIETSILKFHAAADSARLELQFGQV